MHFAHESVFFSGSVSSLGTSQYIALLNFQRIGRKPINSQKSRAHNKPLPYFGFLPHAPSSLVLQRRILANKTLRYHRPAPSDGNILTSMLLAEAKLEAAASGVSYGGYAKAA